MPAAGDNVGAYFMVNKKEEWFLGRVLSCDARQYVVGFEDNTSVPYKTMLLHTVLPSRRPTCKSLAGHPCIILDEVAPGVAGPLPPGAAVAGQWHMPAATGSGL